MDVADPGKWKKSKVESFIRRHLSTFDFGMTRYYEMCMWDNKGALLPSYAILMDKSIVVTENPPKSIIFKIPLSRIQEISLIADRHSLIKGKNNSAYICQHISIVYESLKNKKSKGNVVSNPKKEPSPLTDEPKNINVSLPNSSLNLNDMEDQGRNSSQTDLSVTHSNYSDVSVSPVPSIIEDSFKYSFILSAYEPSMKLNNGSGYAWLKALDSFSASDNNEKNSNVPLYMEHDETLRRSPFATSSTFGSNNGSRERAMVSPQLTWEEWVSMNSWEQRSLIEERKKRPVMEDWKYNEIYEKPIPMYRETLFARKMQQKPFINHPLTEGLRENLPNNRRRKSFETSSRKKISNNSTVSGSETSREERMNKRNKENEDKPPKKGTFKSSQKMEDLHLYFYQRDSEFLNELSLVWNRQQLKNTEVEEDTYQDSKSLVINRSLRTAEKVVTRVAQDWNFIEGGPGPRSHSRGKMSKASAYSDLLRKVSFLHKCLMRYEQLKYLCWKNGEIMSGLLNTLMSCLEPVDVSYKGDSMEFQDAYFDKLAIYAILMDIFRTLFEACNVSWFKETEYIAQNNELYQKENFNEWETDMWDFKLTIFDVTRKLLSSILKCPFLLCSHDTSTMQQRCSLTVTDAESHMKVTAPWLTLSEENAAKMAKLICIAHNASAALLFELLAISHFLPTFMEKTLVTSGIRQANLERFVRLSVTQIINILWSNREPMTAAETMILYRQVWNLRSLARHDRRILQFMRNNFLEEFQYYVRSKGIKTRIPDQYTIKPKVIDACEKLCEDIVGKPGIKS